MSVFEDALGALTQPPTGRNRRISSNEQPNWNDGNFDMTWLTPGETLELPPLTGPGVINHIWMTSHAGGMSELNALSLRIYWDGREEPDVEVPLGDFFATGERPAVVESMPVQVGPTGSLTCYWRMPFAESARIVVTNDNAERSTGLYWIIDWVELDALPADTSYFCAKYRQEYPAVMGRDYLIADLTGRGQYVGTVMSFTLAQDGWFGEGDDFFYIDGETVPSLQGTGTEDYFNDAWGFRPRTSAWFGQPRWDGHRAGDSGVCYRWHVLDPVGFSESLKVTIEHKGNRADAEEAWYIERPDFVSSIAYWYQAGEPSRFAHLPAYPERRAPWSVQHLVPTVRAAEATAGSVEVQAVGFFGGRPSLQWRNQGAGDTLTLPFTVAEDGRYAVRLLAFTTPESGTVDIELDGEPAVTAASFHSDDFAEADLLLGTHALSAGDHLLTFRGVAGQGVDGQSLAVESLRWIKLPPEVDRDVKTHNEAHFIRLGIGRGVYSYRLAYGDLPATLGALVHAGVMPPRYLDDENGHALLSRVEEGRFVVESTAPDGWRHAWTGLDARR
ncbi:DUF2961 domain-containing protein [Candidatus Poribacteria bacterium]|jgi:hypothetical protein|nr:DUF2961 domain-containing protein [Candidatus Poribacteria bacterium]MBT5534134.1 DUF2961 domain-containing protein [Candidatus Poribacteria bacterium]MBT5709956.1 DUF2961 domain-containing protein [Candidatus Poribacteria bacterium]MBT7100413.1 DUF2961 domain-containing protein [Candidatus Poribacteria bacterium]MBT7805471.1 DUF2961 domain-containing protein [Candidatus Poribacteria bacterium]